MGISNLVLKGFTKILLNSQASDELEAANSQLESEIAYLTAEREQLEMMLDAHVCNMDKAAGRGPAWAWKSTRNVDFTLKKLSWAVHLFATRKPVFKSQGHPIWRIMDLTTQQELQVALKMMKLLKN